MRKNLYPWQEACLERWFAASGRGIVNVVTGAGKTLLALAAAERLAQTLSDLKVYIVVPKTFLAAQWAGALREELEIPRREIGICSGKRKDAPNRAFMIYVVNSARYTIARAIVSDFQASRPVLLIADECHHYGTAENARIFGFMEFIPISGQYYSLGLSATPYSAYYKTVLVPALGREIYHYGFQSAIDEGIINPFTVFNIALSFRPDERDEYDEYTESLRIAIRRLKERYPHLHGISGGAFFMQLRALAANGEQAELPRNVQLLLYRRKDVLYHVRERIRCVLSLVRLIRPEAKILIFTERIETTEILFVKLKNNLKGSVSLYHSDMGDGARSAALRRFEDGEIRVLVSCKALDEGLNVPETDVGIIVSSTNSDRQRIQRLGRVLRKKGGNASRLFYLYVEDSAEEMTLLHALSEGMAGVTVIDMAYNEAEGFTNPYYDALADNVIDDIYNRYWDAKKIREVERNLSLGRISCDWLLSEEACRAQATQTKSKTEKNYWVTMLLLAKARALEQDADER